MEMYSIGILILALVVVIVITALSLLSRVKKCKSNEIMVIYGKTKSVKQKDGSTINKSSKIINGGAAFIMPYFQDYAKMSLNPMQISTIIESLSSQMITVKIPVTATVAISTDPAIMQNAAERLLGCTNEQIKQQLQQILIGQMRELVATLSIEELNTDKDKFVKEAKIRIDAEFNKLGITLINLTMADIEDNADYIKNLGKKATMEAKTKASIDIATKMAEGEICVTQQEAEARAKVAQTEADRDITLENTAKERETKTKEAQVAKEIKLSELNKERTIQTTTNANEAKTREQEIIQENEVKQNEAIKNRNVEIANQNADLEAKQEEFKAAKETRISNAEKEKQVIVNKNNEAVVDSSLKLELAKVKADRDVKKEKVENESAVAILQQEKNKEIADKEALAKEAKLKAAEIVPAEIEKKKIEIEVEQETSKITRLAEAKAKAKKMEAEAEADAIYLKMQAEAKGHRDQLFAEAEAKKESLLAEAVGFSEMIKAAEQSPELAIQYKMVDQWKEVAGEQVKAFEHIKLGNITVFDNGQTTGKFLNSLVSTIAPSLGVMDKLPINPKLKELVQGPKDETSKEEEIFDNLK